MNKNCLIFGGGSKFGLDLSHQLVDQSYTVYSVSSTPTSRLQTLLIDWKKCDLNSVDKLLECVPTVDLLIFNQNFSETTNNIDFTESRTKTWIEIQKWKQAHYVNSLLPYQVLNNLVISSKFNNTSTAVWILSMAINKTTIDSSLGYKAQKYLNKEMVRHASNDKNPGHYIGFDPGRLTSENRVQKATTLTNFLKNNDFESLYYKFDDKFQNVIVHNSLV